MLVIGGLSPLARGTRACEPSDFDIVRFIPAGAGNTVRVRISPVSSSVYPRWRGEHDIFNRNVYSPHGLSPLARGTPESWEANIYPARFIPAGAGNTDPVEGEYVISPVYPRWRGEHYNSAGRIVEYGGLSPLARGTH